MFWIYDTVNCLLFFIHLNYNFPTISAIVNIDFRDLTFGVEYFPERYIAGIVVSWFSWFRDQGFSGAKSLPLTFHVPDDSLYETKIQKQNFAIV